MSFHQCIPMGNLLRWKHTWRDVFLVYHGYSCSLWDPVHLECYIFPDGKAPHSYAVVGHRINFSALSSCCLSWAN